MPTLDELQKAVDDAVTAFAATGRRSQQLAEQLSSPARLDGLVLLGLKSEHRTVARQHAANLEALLLATRQLNEAKFGPVAAA